MQISFRTLTLGLMLSAGSFPAIAQPSDPIAAPLEASTTLPLDLSLHPETTSPSAPIDVLEGASADLRSVASWVSDTRDNAGLPYVLVDKVNAQVFVFSAAGRLQAKAPALLGMARGDRLLVPNDAPMSEIPPQKRITPAGRYVSRLGVDSHGKELLVIDYDASISLHPVLKGTPEERRAERLASPTSEDNRISYGCINVPTSFYASVVSPTFTNTQGIVYVLPETGTAAAQFGFQPAGSPPPRLASPSAPPSVTTAGAE